MAAVVTSASVGGDAQTLTSAGVTASGSDRFMFAGGGGRDNYPVAFRYGGSGGTLLTQIGADLGFTFDQSGSGKLNTWGIAPGPTGSTNVWFDIGNTRTLACGAIWLSGVDQSTPVGTEQSGGPEFAGGATTRVASLTVTGLTAGQLVVCALAFQGLDVVVSNVTANANTTVESWATGTSDPGGVAQGVAMISGVASGSSLTLSVNIVTPFSGDVAYRMTAFPVIDAGGGPVEHGTSGALVASPATIAGVAERDRQHNTSGALVAQAASIAGRGERDRQHYTSGALVASAASISGTAERDRQHNTSGALVAQAASIAGLAERDRQHNTSGALVASAAAVAGMAQRTEVAPVHPSTGELEAQAATLAGSASRTHYHDASGSLTAQAATLAGTAERDRQHNTSGALVAQAATVAGAADHTAAGTHATVGDLEAGAATITGVAELRPQSSVLDPKYLGRRKNVPFKPLKPEMPSVFVPDVLDPPPTPEKKRLGKSLLPLDKLPQPPAPAPKAAPSKPAPAPAPKPAPAPAPVPVEPPPAAPPPAPVAPPAASLEQVAALQAELQAMGQVVEGLSAALAEATKAIAEMRAAQEKAAREARNAARAKAIMRKLAEDD